MNNHTLHGRVGQDLKELGAPWMMDFQLQLFHCCCAYFVL